MTQTVDERSWLDNVPSTRWSPRAAMCELWHFRHLVPALVTREIKLRYKQTLIGISWAVLQPLLGMLVFTLVLGKLVDVGSEGLPYAVFVYAALVVWNSLSSGVSRAADSLTDDQASITKVYFPRLIAPLAAIVPTLLDLAVSLGLLLVLMLIFGVAPSVALLLTPLWCVALVAVALSFGVWLSALNVLYRDVRYVLAFFLQLWFFATPVVYSSSLVADNLRWAYALNPAVGLVDGFRWSLIGGAPPPAADLVSAVVTVALLMSGLIFFRRVERQLADRI